LDGCSTYLTTSLLETTEDSLTWRKTALLAEGTTLKATVAATSAIVGALFTSFPSLSFLLPFINEAISLGTELSEYAISWIKWLVGDEPIDIIQQIGNNKKTAEGWVDRICSLNTDDDEN